MCGATNAQEQLQQEEMQSIQQYDQMMQTQYAKQSSLYSTVTSVLQPIFNQGPNQQGMSAAEKATLDAQAVEGTAENYKMAAQAVNEQIAAEGGGGSPAITTGAQQAIKSSIATSAAAEESKQETEIQEQDYALGRENFTNAEEGLMAVAGGENPLGYMQATTNQENVTNQEANAIAEEDNSWINAAIGAAGTIGAAAVGRKP